MESALHVAADHPAYAGHFPGQPILPGVVLLSEAMAAICAARGRRAQDWTLAQAKFLSPVTPGTPLALHHEAQGANERFEIRAGERVVASGVLAARAP